MEDYKKRLIIAGSMLVLSIIVIYVIYILDIEEATKSMLIGYDSEEEAFFTIQNMMWVMFLLGFGELLHRLLISMEIDKGLKQAYLPEDDTSILELKEMPVIFKGVKKDAEVEGGLAEMIKKLVIQFQTSQSIDQTHQMLNSQIEMSSAVSDLNYSMIRYITWFIPTLGFIGTVVGIMMGLDHAATNDPTSDAFLGQVTAKLAVAFYTTLVALVMSSVLVFIMHIVQGREEKLIVKIAQYSLDNFINRLYVNDKE